MELDNEDPINSEETGLQLHYWVTEGKIVTFNTTGFHTIIKQKQSQWA